MIISIGQLNYKVGDFEGNTGKIIREIRKAAERGVDLIVFSELSVCGYPPLDLLEQRDFLEKCFESVRRIAAECVDIAAIVGAPALNPHEKGKKLYNAAYFLEQSDIKQSVYKTLLPTYDIFDEYRYFEPNADFQLVSFKGQKLALTICEDLWDNQPVENTFARSKMYKTSPLEELSKLQPDLIINISASPFSANKRGARYEVLAEQAKKYKLPLVYANQVGANTELIFDGGSMILNAKGEVLREVPVFQEAFLDIDSKDLFSDQNKVVSSMQTSRNLLDLPFNEEGRIEDVYRALVCGVRDYFGKMGFKNAVLGLSGGIDSALTLVLAVDALGKDHVRGILMPSRYSSNHSVEDAEKSAETLGIDYYTVPIQKAVDTFHELLSPCFDQPWEGITGENIQARSRGLLVMAFANRYSSILLNTTNKSEAAVGYGTLYGDMNGGLAVLGDLYKTDVYALSRYINRNEERIPLNSIQKPPSAELKPGQKDTDSLPDYDVLDHILYRYIELKQSLQEIVTYGLPEPEVRRIIRMVNANEYKRFQAPPILRISSKAFGFGRKMPLVASF